jgi:hypothetical protein
MEGVAPECAQEYSTYSPRRLAGLQLMVSAGNFRSATLVNLVGRNADLNE